MMRVVAEPNLGGSANMIKDSQLETWSRWVLCAGLAGLIVPTLLRLATISWSSEQGAHGPIVLVTGLWLLWRNRRALDDAQPQTMLRTFLLLVPVLVLYGIGRVTAIIALEAFALYCALILTIWLYAGPATMTRLWFPLLYLVFVITPPENWMFVTTRPIKMAIANYATAFLSGMGLPVGRTGPVIQVGGYELLVANACSGVNSLLGICALGILYVYLRHGTAPRYALILIMLMLPLAVAANFIRVVFLVLITYYFGDEAAQGVSHELVGLGMFMLAMLMLLGLDALLAPIAAPRTRTAG